MLYLLKMDCLITAAHPEGEIKIIKRSGLAETSPMQNLRLKRKENME
jgi:hypothetical protein